MEAEEEEKSKREEEERKKERVSLQSFVCAAEIRKSRG